MSSTFKPNIQIFKADAAISKGMAVKFGTDDTHVAKGSVATGLLIGLAQSAPTAAEDLVEVALSGGGGKGYAGGTITRGDLVTSDSSGYLVTTTTPGNRVIGVAMQSAVVNDIFDVFVSLSLI